MIRNNEPRMKVEKGVIKLRVEGYRQAARSAGVRLTLQRLEIFRHIASSLEHPDAVAVFRAVRGRMPTVSMDTVYRTLWLLKDLGMIATLGPRRGTVRFDANLSPHHHFICERCGLTRDFESPELDCLEAPASAGSFGKVIAARIELRGVCLNCMKKNSGDRPDKGRRNTWPKKRKS
jgi:Fur family peroxide stress response transcriptional regulator